MPVHLTGRVCEMDKIVKIAKKYKLPIKIVVSADENSNKTENLSEAYTGVGKIVNSDFLNGLDINQAKEIYLKILDDETSNKMPLDIMDNAKKNFDERLQKINWDTYCNDLPFNSSALSLYEWAPIAEELKTLDRKIVLNSVILKWDVIKKEFIERIKF